MLSGNLKDVSILEILQLVSKTKHTGKLIIKGKGVTGIVFVRKGEIVNAQFGDREGVEALNDIIVISNGYFTFEQTPIKIENVINESIDKILLDLSQVLEVRKTNLTLNTIPLLKQDVNSNEIVLSGEEVKVVPLIDGKRSIKEIADESHMSYLKTMEVIGNLIEKSLVEKGKEKQLSKIKPVQLTVGTIRNILSGEDGTWMSHLLGMAPRSLLDEFENEFVVWIDVELVGKWEKEVGKRITSIIATTEKYDELILQISPQISLEDNIVFHEKLAKKFGLKEGDKIEVVPNI